ncbi:MAG: heme exporter protein CcmB [Desulfohalobiaceae bacterium]
MLARVLLLAGKDLRLLLLRGQGIVQAGLLGLLLIFVFSLAGAKTGKIQVQWVAAIFWLASSFSLVLIFNSLYALEEENQARLGLLVSPAGLQEIWLGKALAGGGMLLLLQALFLPAAMIFLGLQQISSWLQLGALLLVVDWGLVVLGSLLGALGQGQPGRDSLLTVIVFPLLVPLLLAGIQVGSMLFQPGGSGEQEGWFAVGLAFDAVFTGAALLLFPFIYSQY